MASPTSTSCTRGTASSWPRRRRVSGTRRSPARSSVRSASCSRSGSTSTTSPACTRSTSGRSHEGLLLEVRGGAHAHRLAHGRPYDCSAHMLWIGERTRASTVPTWSSSRGRQPDRVKLGPTATGEDAVALAERLNPGRIPGRLTFITRMGAGRVRVALPPLLHAVQRARFPSSGCATRCTNLVRMPSGTKTRRFDEIMEELHGCFAAHREVGTWPGRRASRVHGRGRDRSSRQVGGRARGSARQPLRDALRPTPERAPVAGSGVPGRRAHAGRLSTSPCGWRSSARG